MKENKNSNLEVLEENDIGDKEWKVVTKPLNLGSIKNPNRKIKEFKYLIPESR